MKKRILSMILSALIVLSLVSCGGKLPSDEPATPAVPEIATPETNEPTAPTQTEYTFGYVQANLYKVLPECEVEPGVAVIRSLAELEPLVTSAKDSYAYLVEYIFEKKSEATLKSRLNRLTNISEFIRISESLNESFFEQKQLVVLEIHTECCALYVRPDRIYSEDGNLIFDLQTVHAVGTRGHDANDYYTVVISLDKDVALEAGKIILNHEFVTGEMGDLWEKSVS